MASVAAAEGTAAALRSVLSRAQQAAAQAGRAPGSVRVVAVSKTKPVPVIRGVYDAGHRCFGENYVQEFVTKAPQVLILSPVRLRRWLCNFAAHPSRGDGAK